MQTYILFACAYRPANPDNWRTVTVQKDKYGTTSKRDNNQLTFPGLISVAAYLICCEKKRGATPESALEWIMLEARNGNRLRQTPVKTNFATNFSNTTGRVHLFKNQFSSIRDISNVEQAWAALNWVHSVHDHHGKLKIPRQEDTRQE